MTSPAPAAPAGGAAVRNITIVNYSSQFTAAQLEATVAALRIQAVQACTAWGLAIPTITTTAATLPEPATGVAVIGIFDSSTQAAGVLGFHSTDPNGEPYGSVFVDPVLQNGGGALSGELSVSATLSHELLELILDPPADLYAADPQGNLWCFEAADAVESDAFIINTALGSVSVSNFLYRTAFVAGSAGPYDHMNVTTAPFQIAPGGYSVVNGQQQFGPQPASSTAAAAVTVRRATKTWEGSRTSRRVAAFPAIKNALQV
jgi:hypothetical protein